MRILKFSGVIALLLASQLSFAQQKNEISISGLWHVDLGKDHEGKEPPLKSGDIPLPGTLTDHGFGFKTEGADIGILTPTYKYIGTATYSRKINIPMHWSGKQIDLFLERVLWQSTVYIDGQQVDQKDALGVPHLHHLGKLSAGEHELKVEVNNRMIYNIGDKGHAYGESTQTIWNGLLGDLKLISREPTHISSVKTFSRVFEDRLDLKVKVSSEKSQKAKLTFSIKELGSEKEVLRKTVSFDISQGEDIYAVSIDAQDKLQKWSEFNPEVYELSAGLETEDSKDHYYTEFGFLEVGHNGTHVTINGEPIFLRGNLDNVHFPLTGYPSTQIEDWERIFKIYKDYGLNHVRFHSWCPPEAAFKAANRLGIYIQAEASVWVDSWMNEDMIAKGRPEMETKGHPLGLGYNKRRDEWVQAEMNRVVDIYGNHPSFIMFCIGNELGSSDFNQTKAWLAALKKQDGRRLYAGSTARKITEVDDFTVTHLIDNVGWTRGLNGAHTDWDFEKAYSQMDIPILAHEIGQWPVYPAWSEIEKYTGTLKARNLEQFREVAKKNGIADQDEAFQQATGALNQIMYKYEIESFLRTQSCAGIQLLSMQDYQGQGEALVGWLDVFYDSKGITTPATFRQHHSATVPLIRIPKFVWSNKETLKAAVEVSHFGETAINNATLVAQIVNEEGRVFYSRTWENADLPKAELTKFGELTYSLMNVQKPERFTIQVFIDNSTIRNEWSFWVYPEEIKEENGEVLIAEEVNEEVLEMLRKGHKVLLNAHELGTSKNSVSFNYYPLYWSYTYFPGQGKTSLGMLIQEGHDALSGFPTESHSNWQWEPFDKKAKAFILNEMEGTYKPIVQLVDDFHRNNKEGLLFEFKVGEGKLFVSGFDLLNDTLITSKHLKSSVLSYMNSEKFQPEYEVDESFLKRHFSQEPNSENSSKILLHLHETAGDQSNKQNQLAEGVSYTVNDKSTADLNDWQNDTIQIEVSCPDGFLGSFYVKLENNSKEEKACLSFERREKNAIVNSEGTWVKYHVMREDSNDGRLQLEVHREPGSQTVITDVLLEMD
ncbi:glycoside hydrolase family 2 TIM barrel-domain containing protein [Jiulongibacter sp. NS-SX5]|uniref:glycoside hydrolase family 2 TIM barrel-domain containing protein n=1 Tax=Jiulongibacter sp. NS-SX5 TaxID=3463854 RepID=UPI004059CC32